MIPSHCNDGYLLHIDGALAAGVEGWTFTDPSDYREQVDRINPAWKRFSVTRYFRLGGAIHTHLVCGSLPNRLHRSRVHATVQ